jgi:heat shock protein HtpX
MTPEEADAVIAHELGHIRNYDIRLMLIVSVLAGVLTYLADFSLRGMFYSSRDNDSDSKGNPILFIVAIVFAILAPIIATLIQLAISRRREFLADMTSVEITRYPQSMISALEKLRSDDRPVAHATEGNAHMFIDFPLKDAGGFLRKLFSTHPPIEERIEALQKL